MSKTTPNFGLIKPELSDPANITAMNPNWDKLDQIIKENKDEAKAYTDEKIASIPTPDVSGQINTHNTDTSAHNDIRKLVSNAQTTANNHFANTNNPHGVTKSQVGLGNVDNTADSAKPVSTAQATAIADAKKAGTDAQSNLNAHTSNKDNPHGVTAAQVGASPLGHKHTKSEITDFPTSMPASDVYSWAKQSTKPSYTASEVGADPSGTAASAINTHNSSSTAHSDIRELIANKKGALVYTATIGTNWTENEDTGVKSQNVAISGVTANHTAKVDHAYTGNGTSEAYATFVTEENQYLEFITNGYAETYNGGIAFHIFGDVNTVNIPIVVEVV